MQIGKLIVLRLLQTFIAVGSVVIALAVAVWVYPPLFPWGLVHMDRSPYCPQDEAYRASERRYELIQAIHGVQEGMRLLEPDTEGYELWHTPLGQFWIPAGNVGALTVQVAEQRVDLYAGGPGFVNAGDVVLDHGAGVGAYVRQALAAGAGKVVAIETDLVNRECLRRNFKDAIGLGNVVMYPGAVEGEQAQGSSATFYPVFLDSEKGPGVEIPYSKIDLLALELKLDRIDAIKISSRGMILRVLDSAQDTIRNQGPRLALSTEEVEDDEVKISERLAALNPLYQRECRVCGIDGEYMVNPDVVLFRSLGVPRTASAPAAQPAGS